MEKLVERFLTYVKVNTRSDANSQTTPTTVGQVVLAKMIETELHELGLADVHYNEQNGFLTARLPGNQPCSEEYWVDCTSGYGGFFSRKYSSPSHH